MNYWTHFSSWRFWFTCKAAATAWTPSTEIQLDPRLQNVRKQQISSQKYSNVIKKVKHKSPWNNMCCNLPPNHAKKAHPWNVQPPFVTYSACQMYVSGPICRLSLLFQHIPGNNTNNVHFLRNIRTWMAGLTLAPEGSACLLILIAPFQYPVTLMMWITPFWYLGFFHCGTITHRYTNFLSYLHFHKMWDVPGFRSAGHIYIRKFSHH